MFSAFPHTPDPFFQGGRPRTRDEPATRAKRKKEVPPTRENVPTRECQVLEGCGSAAHMRTGLYVSRCDDAWTRVYQERRTLAQSRPGVLYDESHLEAPGFARNTEFTNESPEFLFWESRLRRLDFAEMQNFTSLFSGEKTFRIEEISNVE